MPADAKSAKRALGHFCSLQALLVRPPAKLMAYIPIVDAEMCATLVVVVVVIAMPMSLQLRVRQKLPGEKIDVSWRCDDKQQVYGLEMKLIWRVAFI